MLRPYYRGVNRRSQVLRPRGLSCRIPDAAVGRRDRARCSSPSLSCRIQVHSSLVVNLKMGYTEIAVLRRAQYTRFRRLCRAAFSFFAPKISSPCLCFLLPLLSTLESGATNACEAAAKPAASPAPGSPPEEIPPCPAANSSAPDSRRAT